MLSRQLFLSTIPNKTNCYQDNLSILLKESYNLNFHDKDLFTISNEIPSELYLFDNLYFIPEKVKYDENLLNIFQKITKNNVICKI